MDYQAPYGGPVPDEVIKAAFPSAPSVPTIGTETHRPLEGVTTAGEQNLEQLKQVVEEVNATAPDDMKKVIIDSVSPADLGEEDDGAITREEPGELLEDEKVGDGMKVGTMGGGSNLFWQPDLGNVTELNPQPKWDPNMTIEERMRYVVIPPDPPMDLEEEKKVMAVELDKLADTPYVELHKYRSTHMEALQNLEDTYRLKEADGNVFAQWNILDHSPLRGTPSDKVDIKFHELRRHAKLCIECCDATLRKMGEADMPDKSVSFLSYSMSQSCIKRIEEATASMEAGTRPRDEMNRYINRTRRVQAAYANRTDFDMLFNKLAYPINVWDRWQEIRDDPGKALAKINKTLSIIFQDENMGKCRTLLAPATDAMGEDEYAHRITLTFFFIYWLACVYEQEYESGKCAYVKTLLTNVYDAYETNEAKAASFDIPGGAELFKFTVSTMMSMLNLIIGSSKASLKKDYNAAYDKAMELYVEARTKTIEVDPGNTFEHFKTTSLVDCLQREKGEVVGEIIEELYCLHVHQRSEEQGNVDMYIDPSEEMSGEADPDLDKEYDEHDADEAEGDDLPGAPVPDEPDEPKPEPLGRGATKSFIYQDTPNGPVMIDMAKAEQVAEHLGETSDDSPKGPVS